MCRAGVPLLARPATPAAPFRFLKASKQWHTAGNHSLASRLHIRRSVSKANFVK